MRGLGVQPGLSGATPSPIRIGCEGLAPAHEISRVLWRKPEQGLIGGKDRRARGPHKALGIAGPIRRTQHRDRAQRRGQVGKIKAVRSQQKQIEGRLSQPRQRLKRLCPARRVGGIDHHGQSGQRLQPALHEGIRAQPPCPMRLYRGAGWVSGGIWAAAAFGGHARGIMFGRLGGQGKATFLFAISNIV